MARSTKSETKKFEVITMNYKQQTALQGRSAMGAGAGIKEGKSQVKSFALPLFVFVISWGLCGCSTVSTYLGLQKEEPAYEEQLLAAYNRTKLNKSITLDVLPMLQSSKHEFLSQSDSVVAALGQGKEGYKTWFEMVTFDEYKLTAKRKYFFLVDEKITRSPTNPRYIFFAPRRGLAFDCEMAMSKQVRDESYETEGAAQIAILKQVWKDLRKDIDELGQDVGGGGQNSKSLDICGMLLNQAFETIMLTLETSPVLATKLSERGGVEFEHINFDKGGIQMVVEGDIVRVKIRLGVLTQTFEQ